MYEQYRRGSYMPVGRNARPMNNMRPQTMHTGSGRDMPQGRSNQYQQHRTQEQNSQTQPKIHSDSKALRGALTPLSGLLSSLTGSLDALDGKILGMDTTDLLICAVFLLLYLESRDFDFLILLGVFAFGMTGRSL